MTIYNGNKIKLNDVRSSERDVSAIEIENVHNCTVTINRSIKEKISPAAKNEDNYLMARYKHTHMHMSSAIIQLNINLTNGPIWDIINYIDTFRNEESISCSKV